MVGRGGVRVDNLDLDYASLRGLLIPNASESDNASAAELAIMHLMAAARGLVRSDGKTRASVRVRVRLSLGLELEDRTPGIVRLGRIGSVVASRAQ